MVTIRGSGNGWQDTVSALCVYTHTHLSDLSSLVVVESCLFSVLTIIMYTHPLSSPDKLLFFLSPIPMFNEQELDESRL